MELELNKIEKVVFALLKMALHNHTNSDIDWQNITHEEWNQCYYLSAQHGVMALVWDGIQLIADKCDLPRNLKLKWAVAVLKYEEKYEKYCETAANLSSFFEQHGIEMLQIKGVGFSSYYPIPSHREGGDIDIFTYSSNREKLSDIEANNWANSLMAEQGIKVDTAHQKHSNFTYNNIPIENHKTFVNIYTTSIGASVNELLLKIMQPQIVELCQNKYLIKTPSAPFNALFLSFHSAQHFGIGIQIHHLFDWACLLKKEGWCLPEQIKDKRFLNFIYGMTYLSNILLGTNVVINGSASMVKSIYEQMMHSPYSEKIPVKGNWSVFCYKLKRMIYAYKMMKKVFDITFFRMINNSIQFHLNKCFSR